MKTFLRDNGLTLVLLAMFAGAVGGMLLTGRAAYNEELARHGRPILDFLSYVQSGDFLSALFENWESEFLQMAVYVLLTAMLFQRGSAESRDPDDPGRPMDEVPWRARFPVAAWVYAHSLGLALALLFLASLVLHCWFSLTAANAEAIRHGRQVQTLAMHVVDSQFWFESFQNWQSEFMSTAVLIVLSIVLRQKGSPESKPVAAANAEGGD